MPSLFVRGIERLVGKGPDHDWKVRLVPERSEEAGLLPAFEIRLDAAAVAPGLGGDVVFCKAGILQQTMREYAAEAAANGSTSYSSAAQGLLDDYQQLTRQILAVLDELQEVGADGR